MLGVSAHGFSKSTKDTARIESFFGATTDGPTTVKSGGKGEGMTFPDHRVVPTLSSLFSRAGPSGSSATGGGGVGAGRKGKMAAYLDGNLCSKVVVAESGAEVGAGMRVGKKRLHVDMTDKEDARAEDGVVISNSGEGGDGGVGVGVGVGVTGVDVGAGVGVGDVSGAEDARRRNAVEGVPGGGGVSASAAESPLTRRRRPNPSADDDKVLCWVSSAAPSTTTSPTGSASDGGGNPTAVRSSCDAHQSRTGRRDDANTITPRQENSPRQESTRVQGALPPPRSIGVIAGTSALGGSESGDQEGGEEIPGRGRDQSCGARRYQQRQQDEGVGGKACADLCRSGDVFRGEGHGAAATAADAGRGRGQGEGGGEGEGGELREGWEESYGTNDAAGGGGVQREGAEAWREAAAMEQDGRSERDGSGGEINRRALFGAGGASGVFGDVDADVLAALPPEIQREIWMQQVRRETTHALRSTHAERGGGGEERKSERARPQLWI